MSPRYDPAAAIESPDLVTQAYHTHYPLLAHLAERRFGIPADDVRPLIHEVFISYIRDRERVADVRAWLVGATCNRCRFYWRTRGREAAALQRFGSDSICDAADVAARMDLKAALAQLPTRCRDVLRLRFEEGYSSAALAAYFETTVGYARKMVYRCAAAARSLLSTARRSSR